MAQYPSLKDDRVLYNRSDIYADQDIKITLLDGSILDVWGSVFVNGNPISLIGSIPIASQAEAEAGVNNSNVMTPLRTAQAIDVQAVDKALVDAKGDLLVGTANDVVARLPVGTDNYVLTADSVQTNGMKWAAPVGSAGVTDGDKGDIVVSGGGATWLFDSTVVTAAAKTVLDDASTAAMLATLGGTNQSYVDTQVATKQPLDSDLTTIAGLTATTDNVIQSVASAWASRTPAQLKTTLALTKSDVGLSNVDNTSDATKPIFTTTVRGLTPPPTAITGKFLMDDGTWAAPASSLSGVGGVFPFTYNTSAVEPPIGNQLRGNNATFASSTKLWIMETTTDGLDVTVGLGRIKAGFQVYIQNYNNSAQYAIWNVTADATDKGAYWEVTVSPVSSAGTIPGGKVALQTLSAAQANNLFSTTTTASGLTPGSSGVGSTYFLNGAGAWAVPAGGGGVTDGNKGDIVVSGSGATWLFDSTVVTAAAKTVLDDTTTAAMLTTLGAQPVDTDLTTIAGLTATTDNIIQSVGSAWASRTPTQVKTVLALDLVSNTSDATKNSATATLTNKRITKRTGTTTSSATPTINTDDVDFYSLTAQTVDITSFTTNLSGTPTEAQTLWIAITGTAARAITWGASFEASTQALPTTTVTTARLDVGFVWNTVTSKWRCIAAA